MKLLVIILNKTEVLDYLLDSLSSAGIGGATIIESSGMAKALSKVEGSFVGSSLRGLFAGEEQDNRTIFSVIKDNQLDIARKVVYNTVGDLSKPNTGIMFTLPIDYAEGTKKTAVPHKDNRSDKKGKENSHRKEHITVKGKEKNKSDSDNGNK